MEKKKDPFSSLYARFAQWSGMIEVDHSRKIIYVNPVMREAWSIFFAVAVVVFLYCIAAALY